MKKVLVLCFAIGFGILAYAADGDYPESGVDKRADELGSIANIKNKDGEPLFKLGLLNQKLKKKRKSSQRASSMRSCMWKSAIKFLESKPIIVSDSRGGLLSTDWFEEPNTFNERRKINIVVSGSGKKASFSATVFKQTLTNGIWRDAGAESVHLAAKVVEQINKIMTENGCFNEDKDQQ